MLSVVGVEPVDEAPVDEVPIDLYTKKWKMGNLWSVTMQKV